MHVSLTAEKLFDLGPLPVTNSLMTTWLVILLITLFAIVFRLRLKKNPKGAQNLVEAMMEAFRGAIDGVTNSEKQTRKFFPIIVTIFLFVLLNNWAGLIPGVGSIGFHEQSTETHEVAATSVLPKVEASDLPTATLATSEATPTTETSEAITPATEVKENYAQENTETDTTITKEAVAGATEEHAAPFVPIFRPGTADLSFTLALAFCAVLLTQIMGVMSLGGWGYFSRFINFKNPIHFFVGLLEIVSEFSKMISFSFRLFGNIFAGEVLLTVIISLVPYVVPMPFYALEIFVGAVQALVFAALTLVFFKGAVTEAH